MLSALIFLLATSGAANPPDLWVKVNGWKHGDEIPVELTRPRQGFVDDCGIAPDLALHSIQETPNVPLLEELVLSREATPLIFTAALGRLLELNGFPNVRRWLIRNPELRAEHAALRQLFEQDVVRVYGAAVRDIAMPRERATLVLSRLKALLESGVEWLDAYRTVANENPDTEAGLVGPTLLTYTYSGWLTRERFDVQSQTEAGIIPQSHVKALFDLRSGPILLEAYDGLYLYWVVEHHEPEI